MGGCEQCYQNICVGAPCHLSCRIVGETCETIVNGDPGFKQGAGSAYSFIQVYRLESLSPLLEAAGLGVGDGITHVDIGRKSKSKFPRSLSQFGQLAKRLRPGDRVFVYRSKDDRFWVTL